MKAIDTNVLVRYLVQDDPKQSKKAAAYIEAAAAAGDTILISTVVLCETVWVLDSAYGYSKSEIETVLDHIFQTSSFRFEAKDTLRAALEDYRATKADFADCLIGRAHRSLGCEPTATFDTGLRSLTTFHLL
jgi:predicted nucleic-acid-binding protein